MLVKLSVASQNDQFNSSKYQNKGQITSQNDQFNSSKYQSKGQITYPYIFDTDTILTQITVTLKTQYLAIFKEFKEVISTLSDLPFIRF